MEYARLLGVRLLETSPILSESWTQFNFVSYVREYWVIGPGGGEGGGRIVAQGAPEQIAQARTGSYTGRELLEFLGEGGSTHRKPDSGTPAAAAPPPR